MNHHLKSLAISGWAQPYDALNEVSPQGCLHLDYHTCNSVDAVMRLLKTQPNQDFDSCIGWSLGGVLLLYALTHNIITTKQLVLIGVPYQFVSSDVFSHGMDTLTFQLFHQNYQQDSARTAKRFASLIAHGDKHADKIIQNMVHYPHQHNKQLWLPWLEALRDQRTNHFEFEHFPPTLILHGTQDRIVSHQQAALLQQHIPHAELVSLEACGHAPHLHHPDYVRDAIASHAARHTLYGCTP
jgi:malonyl-CoA O-methyltransferase